MLRNIEKVVREEMNALGCQEVLMSSLAPKAAYEKTGRYEKLVGDILFEAHSRHVEGQVLNQSHEEVVVPMLQQYVSSYRDLPFCVYQIQQKFRGEARPKSGLLRGREFLMKDAYSFHEAQEDLETYYEKMKAAYFRIFKRLGLEAFCTTASGGSFTKKFSHEFQVLCEAGEDVVAAYADGTYANTEVAVGTPDNKNTSESMKPLEIKKIERGASIHESVKAHALAGNWQVLKTVIFKKENGDMVGVCLRGDVEVSEVKVSRFFGEDMAVASSEDLKKAGLIRGYISPLEASKPQNVTFYGDISLETVRNFCTGNNEEGVDVLNANLTRDFSFDAPA